MDYIRNSGKACISDIEKEKFGFDYNQELIKYKFYIGEKVKLHKIRTVQKPERGCSYISWKEYIENKYKDKSKKELEEFAFYLKRRINTHKPEGELYTILFSVICAEGLVQLFKYLLCIQDALKSVSDTWVIVLICLIAEFSILLIVACVFYKIISPIYDNNVESFFMNEYLNVINQMLDISGKGDK